jgi:hypothetical protein
MEQVDVKAMTRDELESFAQKTHHDCLAAKAGIRLLDEQMTQVDSLLRETAPIDPDVVEGWRQWIGKLQEEVDLWATKATKVSAENQRLKATEQERYGALRDELGQAYEAIDVLSGAIVHIREHCQGHNDEKKLTVLREALDEISKLGESALVSTKKYAIEPEPDHSEEMTPLQLAQQASIQNVDAMAMEDHTGDDPS